MTFQICLRNGVFISSLILSWISLSGPLYSAQPLIAIVSTQPTMGVKDHLDSAMIWINKADKSQSYVLVTDKHKQKGGLRFYNLKGDYLSFWGEGRLNSIDYRTGFTYQGQAIDLIAATHRGINGFCLYTIDPKTMVLKKLYQRVTTEDKKVYGGCLYHDIEADQFYFFLTYKDGTLEKWQIKANNTHIDAEKIETIHLTSQAEGCVADDENNTLYVAEEKIGVWKFKLSDQTRDSRELIAKVGEVLVADLEGVALYKGQNGTGYLIVSSQGNNSYAIFDRQENHKYRGRFQIADKRRHLVKKTDGIAVSSENLGSPFELGAFISHDNMTDRALGSSFKYLAWQSIAQELGLH